VSRLIRDCRGASLIEFTLVFPILILVTFGTVDVTYMLFEWNQASKAAYRGARVAIVSNPVASVIRTQTIVNPEDMGDLCFDPATGVANGKCPTFTYTCGSVAGGACPGYDGAAFTAIVQQMQQVFPRLQPAHVQIVYQTSNLGFVGRPDGLPVTVTVSIRCMTHEIYFLGGLAQWILSGPGQGCPAGPIGLPIPAFASSLPSEDLVTN
jgi:hypothetical protein